MNNDKPLFMQIIEMIEDEILSGAYREDELVISTTQIAKLLQVNLATAQKAVAILADKQALYKKRGVGMAVAPGAQARILAARKEEFLSKTLPEFVQSGKKVGLSSAELVKLVKEAPDV
ncbi:MAG: GntR family transcriptional regulator [Coriobacteriales bacterium]|jgi:DNA-binding transcriptional regulator YhcF (GntR family)|nr:GntR family transcriptional regulator [Coriobacteriales bacterium]